jgi:hypothetical protein
VSSSVGLHCAGEDFWLQDTNKLQVYVYRKQGKNKETLPANSVTFQYNSFTFTQFCGCITYCMCYFFSFFVFAFWCLHFFQSLRKQNFPSKLAAIFQQLKTNTNISVVCSVLVCTSSLPWKLPFQVTKIALLSLVLNSLKYFKANGIEILYRTSH